MTSRLFKLAACVGFASLTLVTGCVKTVPPLYYWGHYQDEVYEHFKIQGSSPEKEIAVLEADLQVARSKGLNPPPGFHAHLGLLYAQLEKNDQAMHCFDAESNLYPESSSYMHFLMKKKNSK